LSISKIAGISFAEYFAQWPARYPLDRVGAGIFLTEEGSLVDVDYPNLLNNFREHLDPKRSESASFLIWYLEKYYRLDKQEAVDAVCDQSNDKGVDGIFINDNDQTITIFQSKISQKSNSSVGDAPLRDFSGTLQQFATKERVENLVKTAGPAQVASLIKRSDLFNKLSTHDVRGEFLINLDIDQNGKGFLDAHDSISFVGKSDLISHYISSERAIQDRAQAVFDVLGIDVAQHVVDVDQRAVIAAIRAKELVALDGIADQSLFAFNVRGPLGKTKVNKDMTKSILDNTKHKIFPLFHNGITIIARKIEQSPETIKIEGYHVVNGCQSISTLFNNKAAITDDLRVLTKFIQLDPASAEAKMITEYSNNQNAVKPRDFKSNHQIQIRLQAEFKKYYNGTFAYEIKRGDVEDLGEPISNEDAGLYLMAFDLKEPWATHRKYEIFEDKHSALFGRPEVTADRIIA
jgi:AIPR protein